MNKYDRATLSLLTACYEFWHIGLKTPAMLHMLIRDKHAENISYPPPVCPAVSRQQSIQLLLITASCIDNVLSYAIK